MAKGKEAEMVAKNERGDDKGLWAACSPFAALLALHPALDANYRAVAGDAYAFDGKAT